MKIRHSLFLSLVIIGFLLTLQPQRSQAQAQHQGRLILRGQITVFFKDGTTRESDRISLAKTFVKLDEMVNGEKINAQLIEYVELFTERGETIHFEQADVTNLIWNIFPATQRNWLHRIGYSPAIEIYQRIELKNSAVGGALFVYENKVHYFRKYDGQILRVSPEAVIAAVQDDPEALAIAEQGKKKYNHSIITRVVGAALFAGGTIYIASNLDDDPRLRVGFGVTVAGFFTYLLGNLQITKSDDYLLDALKAYRPNRP